MRFRCTLIALQAASFSALLVVGCEPTAEIGESPPSQNGSAGRVNQAGDSPLASGTPKASATPAAEPPPKTIRTPRPASERPSAHAERPPIIKKARWDSIFGAYGHLLDIDDILDEYHVRYPNQTEVITLAKTHQGREVRAIVLADDISKVGGRPSVFLNAAHHGNEPLSSILVLDAIENLLSRSKTDPKVKRQLSEFAIWCVPMVNPDGFATYLQDLNAGRKNGRDTFAKGAAKILRNRGVDLNRNYPFRWGFLNEAGSRSQSEFRSYRGPAPASEPEVRALVDLSDRQHFVGSLSFHVGTVALLAPYTISGVPNPTPNEAWVVAEQVARSSPANGERPVYVLKNLYPVDGTDQDYHRGAHGTVALLYEAAARNWESNGRIQKTVDLIRPAWKKLFDRYLDGPSVEGHVKDESGRPLGSQVEVVEVKTEAGEVWKSRCPDGFFGRYLPSYGKFTVRVTPTGKSPIDTPVEVTKEHGRIQVDIVVPGENAQICHSK